MAQHDVSKLPKWARDRIENLERDLRVSEERCRRLFDREPEPVSGRVVVESFYGHNPGSNGEHDQPLPDHSTIRFHVGDMQRWNNYIDVRMERTEDGLAVQVRGHDRIAITPHSSNVAIVKLDKP